MFQFKVSDNSLEVRGTHMNRFDCKKAQAISIKCKLLPVLWVQLRTIHSPCWRRFVK